MKSGDTMITDHDQIFSDLEERFAEAIVNNDVTGIETLTHDDWVVIEAGGNLIPRDAFLEVVESGILIHSSMVNRELRIRRFETSAVVTGLATTDGIYRGEAFRLHERFTDVWVRDNDQWRCALTQLTSTSTGESD